VEFARHVGWIGVDLFFVLSGFLISGLLFVEYIAHGQLRLKLFLIRRGLKIYPAFYVLLIYAVVTRLYLGRPISPWAALSEGFFVANYGPSLWSHTWSLGVEEHFYLLLGLCLWILARRRGPNPFRPLVPILLLVAIMALTARVATTRLLPYEHKTHLFPTHLRIDSLGFGVLLGYLYHFHRERLFAFVAAHRVKILGFGILLILPATQLILERDSLMVTLGLTGLYLGFGACLLCALIATRKPVLLLRWIEAGIAAVGLYSYSIYLWHIPTIGLATRLSQIIFGASGGPIWVRILLYLLASILVGVGMARLIELPVLRLRDHWFPARRPPQALLQPTPVSAHGSGRSGELPGWGNPSENAAVPQPDTTHT